jgi:hypothetical protein
MQVHTSHPQAYDESRDERGHHLPLLPQRQEQIEALSISKSPCVYEKDVELGSQLRKRKNVTRAKHRIFLNAVDENWWRQLAELEGEQQDLLVEGLVRGVGEASESSLYPCE